MTENISQSLPARLEALRSPWASDNDRLAGLSLIAELLQEANEHSHTLSQSETHHASLEVSRLAEVITRAAQGLAITAASDTAERFERENLARHYGARTPQTLIQSVSLAQIRTVREYIEVGKDIQRRDGKARFPALASAVRSGSLGLGAAREIRRTLN